MSAGAQTGDRGNLAYPSDDLTTIYTTGLFPDEGEARFMVGQAAEKANLMVQRSWGRTEEGGVRGIAECKPVSTVSSKREWLG